MALTGTDLPSALASAPTLDLTLHPAGLAALAIFVAAYVLVVLEERIHLRKSKPVMVAAGLIWALIAWQASAVSPDLAGEAFRHIFL